MFREKVINIDFLILHILVLSWIKPNRGQNTGPWAWHCWTPGLVIILLTQEIRAQEERENAESLGCEPGQRPGGTGVRVSTNMATPANMLTDREMECITTVFRCVISVHEVTLSIEKNKNLTQRSFETGLRGATIYPSVSRYFRILSKHWMVFIVYQDLHPAMKMLGLNPSEQEVVDIPNNIAKYESGLRFFLCW